MLHKFSINQHKENIEQWIRAIYNFNNKHFLIIYCIYIQAKAFQHVIYIEIDLLFKMV